MIRTLELVDEVRGLRARNNELEGLTEIFSNPKYEDLRFKIEENQLKEKQIMLEKNLFFVIVIGFCLAFVLVIIFKCI